MWGSWIIYGRFHTRKIASICTRVSSRPGPSGFFGLHAVPFLGLFEGVLDRLVRVEVVRLYASRAAVGAHDLVFLGVNRVRARPVLREHVPTHGAHELRIRHDSTPFSLPDGTRVRTPSAFTLPPALTTFLPGFALDVYRLAVDTHVRRIGRARRTSETSTKASAKRSYTAELIVNRHPCVGLLPSKYQPRGASARRL